MMNNSYRELEIEMEKIKEQSFKYVNDINQLIKRRRKLEDEIVEKQ